MTSFQNSFVSDSARKRPVRVWSCCSTKARRAAECVLLLLVLMTGSLAAATNGSFQILVFSKTVGFRHASIADGIAAVKDVAALNNFGVVMTEDASVFTDAGLAGFKAVVFLNTTGDILDANEQGAFQRYIQGGGGFVGVHGADRKSTRLNSSHVSISYAVFCLNKKRFTTGLYT